MTKAIYKRKPLIGDLFIVQRMVESIAADRHGAEAVVKGEHLVHRHKTEKDVELTGPGVGF